MRTYIADLAAYNEGKLIGFWLDLENLTADEIKEAIQEWLDEQTEEQGILREEYAVHDWEEIPSHFGEYPDWEEVAEYVEAVDTHGAEIVEAADACGVPLDRIDDAYHGVYDSEQDFAEQLLDDLGELQSIPEHLRYYFDYEAYARDLFISDFMSHEIDHDYYIFSCNY